MMDLAHLDRIDPLVEDILARGRIPGAAIAVVAGGETVFARGYGLREMEGGAPATPDTAYPIASTTKALNATLIGMLVDEGRIGWDVPVQHYLPRFRLADPVRTPLVTVRDLVAMRTGLPRHDWVWIENPVARADLVDGFGHLQLTAGFREKFQYNNLTVTLAGHIAETVTGRSWEDLARERLFEPLGMRDTGFATTGTGTLSWHEDGDRRLALSTRLSVELTAPSGGSIHSTVSDMARWLAFNLDGGKVDGRQLIAPATLAAIHSPQMVASMDHGAPSATAAYGLGWYIDHYSGHPRISHGGYLHDVNSEAMLFPKQGIGIVCFTNFGFPTMAKILCPLIFDTIMGLPHGMSLADKQADYEQRIADRRAANAAVTRVAGTTPSHPLPDHAGRYVHPAYGAIDIAVGDDALVFRRGALAVPLMHWHYDAWVAARGEPFALHTPHCFERTSPLRFETGADGAIAAFTFALEPAAAPIRFVREDGSTR